MPLPIVALPCGSRSIRRTRCPCDARLAARLTAVVVLPTPPFWFATQKIFAIVGISLFTASNGVFRIPRADRSASGAAVDRDFDEMPLRLERRHSKADDLRRSRTGRPPLYLAVGRHALHSPDRSALGNQMTRKFNEIGELCERARHDYIEFAGHFDAWAQGFDASGHD